jgi:protein O-mannosyl-transferase
MGGKNKKQVLLKVATSVKEVSKTFIEDTRRNDRTAGILCMGIVAAVYFISLFNGFTNWDDQGYVTGNELIKSLSFDNIKKIFVTPVMGNYHPLTMLSYAVEYSIAGLSPFIYHLTNLLLHVLNTWLVYRVTRGLSANIVISFVTAVLFGIHPMHVESVAWISERKDVLYACFFLSSLIFYIRYVKGGGRKMLFLSLFLFLLSLLSKGQAVSLTIVLFGVDFWLKRQWSLSLITEKIPFLLLSLAFGIAAIYVQHSFGYMQVIKLFSFTDRLFFACYALVLYLYKLILPVRLSCFYPFPAKMDFFIYA